MLPLISKASPPNIPLLFHAAFGPEEFADAVGQVFVIGHAVTVAPLTDISVEVDTDGVRDRFVGNCFDLDLVTAKVRLSRHVVIAIGGSVVDVR